MKSGLGRRRVVALIVLAVIAMLAASCGSASFSIGGKSVEEAAEELIAGDLADQLGLGALTPDCPAVEDPEVGTTFQCTATTPDGATIEFDGVVSSEDIVNVQATNVAEGAILEQGVAATFNAQNPDAGVTADDVACGGDKVVVVDRQVICEVTPPNGPTQTATLTINDLAAGDIDTVFTPSGDTVDSGDADDAAEDADEGGEADEASAGGNVAPEQAAQAVLLTGEDFDASWSEAPQTESEVDYGAISGCEFVGELVDNDGFVAEAESSEFSMGDIAVDHAVRVYPDAETAADIVFAWAEQATVDCVVAGAQQAAGAALEAGELGPVENVEFSLQAFEDFEGEPRVTNLELTNRLIAPDAELILINDQYFIQVGNLVSRVGVLSPDAPWESTPEVLQLVADRMATVTGG